MEFILTFLAVLVVVYFFILLAIHSLFLPRLNLHKYKKEGKPLIILSLFPHPDDETMNMGGTLARYSKIKDVQITVVSVTKGEAGETNGLCMPEELGTLRSQELETAMHSLGIEDVRLWDFPDGGLIDHRDELKVEVKKLLETLHPDVVITYDNSGLYGHPDHIILSQVTTELLTAEFKAIKLLYATLPAKIVKIAQLPETINLYGKEVDMNSGELVRTVPILKTFISPFTLGKVRAIKAHRSQGLEKNLPIPLWAYMLFMCIEYFSEGN